ncbi:hypothetical protein ACFCZ2_21010 [Streptomyces sp. NPDC056202]|uniref:hypothetical protein n=1 Tax=unclassified Streptomyces TaxID=2593676 RepID=UPI0009394841|nr:hypothetical protein [Streptomyces sp. CB02009]OKJ52344.1 hypothetical protein AMK27_31520 [Streptomyces sp. CB02009]
MTSSAVPPQLPAPAVPTWVLWLLLMLSSSLVVALVVGILKSFGGAGLAEASLTGGAAFGGAFGLCLTAVPVMKQLRKTG